MVRPVSLPRLERALSVALAAAGVTDGEHLLVATSGGPDSTAVLVALAAVGPRRGLRLTAAHVDHRLRGAESAADAATVAALARALGVPYVACLAAVDPGAGLEARARRARYRALARAAADVGATRIVTGHTEDDQVETILLRLLRGAGRGGLGGMRPVRGRLVRPLLGVTRADVRRYLAGREIGFAIDRTNAELRHARNRVRRLLVPFLAAEWNPRLGPALAALGRRLRDEDDFLAAAARARAATLVRGSVLDTGVAHEPPALARRIVRAWLEQGAPRGAGAEHVERVLALARGAGRGAVAVPGPAHVVREGAHLVRRPGRSAEAPRPFVLPIAVGEAVTEGTGRWRLALSAPRARLPGEVRPADPARALFDADALPTGLVVRGPAPGDRVRVLGVGTRKLQDILVDAKVPRAARPGVPVLAAPDGILWVAGLARGAGAAVGPATTRIVDAAYIVAPGSVC